MSHLFFGSAAMYLLFSPLSVIKLLLLSFKDFPFTAALFCAADNYTKKYLGVFRQTYILSIYIYYLKINHLFIHNVEASPLAFKVCFPFSLFFYPKITALCLSKL